MNEALLAPYSNSLADMGQVFEDDGISWLKAIHNAPTDDVVEVFHPVALPTRQPFQGALSTRRAFTLETAWGYGVYWASSPFVPVIGRRIDESHGE
jgi:hypothetical protein